MCSKFAAKKNMVDFEMILVSNLVSRPVRHVPLVLKASVLVLEYAIENNTTSSYSTG